MSRDINTGKKLEMVAVASNLRPRFKEQERRVLRHLSGK